MASTRFLIFLTILITGVCLLQPTSADERKQKKVIIKVPQIIKHIHHHHVKKVHVYEEKPKKELHYGPFLHHHDTLITTKGLGEWTSGDNGVSTEGEWKLPKTLDGWNNYFKKGFGGDFDDHGKSSDEKYEGGEPWKESDISNSWKGGEDWIKNWGGEKQSGGVYESSNSGGDDSHVMYEFPSGTESSGNLGEVHSYGDNSFEGAFGGDYKSHKRENRGLQIGTHLNQFVSQEIMRQPEIMHAYEPSEDNKQGDWFYGVDVPTSQQSSNVADLGHTLLMQNADTSQHSAYLNGQYAAMQSNNDKWMPFNVNGQ